MRTAKTPTETPVEKLSAMGDTLILVAKLLKTFAGIASAKGADTIHADYGLTWGRVKAECGRLLAAVDVGIQGIAFNKVDLDDTRYLERLVRFLEEDATTLSQDSIDVLGSIKALDSSDVEQLAQPKKRRPRK